MPRIKISNALKGFVALADEPMEKVFDRILRSISVPLSRPVEEVIGNCIERERRISGCMDTGWVLADLDPAEDFSSELILGLGVSARGIRWRWGVGAPPCGYLNIPVHFVLVVLAVDGPSRLRTLRASSTIFQADSEPGRSILGATSLAQAISILREFEGSPIHM
jgi:hypothetical protein